MGKVCWSSRKLCWKVIERFCMSWILFFSFLIEQPCYIVPEWISLDPGAQPRLQSWGVQFLGLGYYYLSTEKNRQVYPVWCSRLHNHTLFIKNLCKKLEGPSKFWGGPDSPTPSGCAHDLTPQMLCCDFFGMGTSIYKEECNLQTLSTKCGPTKCHFIFSCASSVYWQILKIICVNYEVTTVHWDADFDYKNTKHHTVVSKKSDNGRQDRQNAHHYRSYYTLWQWQVPCGPLNKILEDCWLAAVSMFRAISEEEMASSG